MEMTLLLNTKLNLAVKVTVSSSLALSNSLPLNAATVTTSTSVVFQTRVPFLLPFLPPVGTSFRKGKGSRVGQEDTEWH